MALKEQYLSDPLYIRVSVHFVRSFPLRAGFSVFVSVFRVVRRSTIRIASYLER